MYWLQFVLNIYGCMSIIMRLYYIFTNQFPSNTSTWVIAIFSVVISIWINDYKKKES